MIFLFRRDWVNLIEKIKKEWKSKKLKFAMIILSILMTIFFLQNNVYLHIKISSLNQNGSISIYTDYGDGFSELSVLTKNIDSYSQRHIKVKIAHLNKIKNIRLDFDSTQELIINSISFGTRFIELGKWSNSTLEEIILNTQNISSQVITSEGVNFKTDVNDPQIYLSSDTINEMQHSNYKVFNFIEKFIIYLILLVIIISLIKLRKIDSLINLFGKNRDKLNEILTFSLKGILCCAIIVIFIISIQSSINRHPDELVSFFAANYYTEHWSPPDLRDPNIAYTYSVYGNSRLSELSPYYFVVGKLSVLMTYVLANGSFIRFANFAMLMVMTLIFLVKYKKYPFMAVILCLTPQLWYLYSYVTSDGWDYFVSFLALYQFINSKSMLNKALVEPKSGRNIARVLFVSLLFALILMGKPNYYILLILFFFILLFKLIDCEKTNRKSLFLKLLIILSCVFLFLGIRMIPDFVHYGHENRSAVKKEMKEVRAQYQFKTSTPLEEKYDGLNLYNRGISLKELLIDKKWVEITIKSFMGVYGYMQYFADPKYYEVLLYLYFGVYCFILYYGFTTANKRKRMLFLISQMLVFLSVGLSLYNSWFLDFQPQGRYLLPILLILAFSTTLNKKIYQNIAFKLLLCTIGVLSLYSLLSVGLVNLV